MSDNVIELQVQVNAETGGLTVAGQGLEKVAEQAQSTEKSFLGLSGQAAAVAKAFLGFASAAGILNFFKSAVEEAERETQALNRLKFAIEASGQAWLTHAKAVEQWGQAIQRSTRFSDTEAFDAVGRLTRATGDLAQAQRAAQVAMGLSVISGKDLATTTEEVSNLIAGQERAVMLLRREYRNLTDNATTSQNVMDALARNVGAAAFAEDSLTKNTRQLKGAISDLQEQVGRGLTPALILIVRWAENGIRAFQSWASVVASAMAGMVTAVTGAFRIFSNVTSLNFRQAAQEANNLKMQLKAIFDATGEDIKQTWSSSTTAVQAAMQDQTRIITHASGMQEKFIKNLQDQIKSTFDGMTKDVGGAFAKMLVDGEDFTKSMEEAFRNMAKAFISAVIEMMIKWAAFQALTGGAGGAAGGIGGFSLFAKGADTVVSRPTMFMAGEAGPERVRVSPIAGDHDGGGSSGGSANISIGDINVTVSLQRLDSGSAQQILDVLARELRTKVGPAVRFALASKDVADRHEGIAF